MSNLNIRPTGSNILVELVDTEDVERKTKTGIIMPQTGQKMAMKQYKVLAQGPDIEEELVGQVMLAHPMALIGHEVLGKGVEAGEIYLITADPEVFRGVIDG